MIESIREFILYLQTVPDWSIYFILIMGAVYVLLLIIQIYLKYRKRVEYGKLEKEYKKYIKNGQTRDSM